MRYSLLRSKTRLRIREISRDSLMRCGGVKELALKMAERRVREEYGTGIIATILLSLAIKLAVELILYWIKNKFSAPSGGKFIKGEPGA